MKHEMTYTEAVELTAKYHELEKIYSETWEEPKSKNRTKKLEKISNQLNAIYNQLPKFCY